MKKSIKAYLFIFSIAVVVGTEMLLKLFLLVVLIKISAGFQPPWMFMGRPLSGFRQMNIDGSIDEKDPEWLEQNLDHFGKIETKWKQRYWKNDEYAESDGPQFLILGGDAPATYYDVFDERYSHVQQAKDLNGTLWILEHRFYGESQPLGNLKTESLKYLTSQQALADIAHFIRYQNSANNYENPKWIIFGGSFAGTLAIWFKGVYPDLCTGVVASSAPIELRLDFYDYTRFIEHLIQSYSSDCANNFKIAFKDFEKCLADTWDGKYLMSRSFFFNPAWENTDVTYDSVSFVYSIILSYFQAAIQYTNTETLKTNVDIAFLCKNMASSEYGAISYKNIAYAITNIASNLPMTYSGIDISYNDLILYLQDCNSSNIQQQSTRAWMWQACNEFGSFITTNSGRSIFGNHISYDFYLGLCSDVFGEKYNIINIQKGLQNIQSKYGLSSTYCGSNIIVTKNSYDPWSLLALKKPNDPSIITYEITGTGHCADMAHISDDDNESLKQYRKLVFKTIKKWIGISE